MGDFSPLPSDGGSKKPPWQKSKKKHWFVDKYKLTNHLYPSWDHSKLEDLKYLGIIVHVHSSDKLELNINHCIQYVQLFRSKYKVKPSSDSTSLNGNDFIFTGEIGEWLIWTWIVYPGHENVVIQKWLDSRFMWANATTMSNTNGELLANEGCIGRFDKHLNHHEGSPRVSWLVNASQCFDLN